MMSIVPAFSFSEPGLVNQLSDFQTGFTPWGFDCSDFFSTIHLEPVVLSPCSGESKTGSVKINTGFLGSDDSLVGSIKTNSGSDVTDCFNGVPSPQSDELDSENTRIQINTTNSGLIRTNTLSGESWMGSIKTNSGSAKIDTGYGESWIGSTKTNSGSDVIDCFNGVPSPQSDELDSENTRIGINVMNSDENARRKLNRPVLEVVDDRKRKRMESNRESARRSRMRKQRLIKNLEDEVNRLGLENRELKNRLRIVVYHIEKIRMDNNQLLSEQELLRRRFLEMRQILILRQLQQNMI